MNVRVLTLNIRFFISLGEEFENLLLTSTVAIDRFGNDNEKHDYFQTSFEHSLIYDCKPLQLGISWLLISWKPVRLGNKNMKKTREVH